MKILSDIKKILTLHCDESAELLSKQQDTSLNRTELVALRFHLFICRACRRYKKQLQFIRKVLMIMCGKEGSIPTEFKMSEKKRMQIKNIINEQSDA